MNVKIFLFMFLRNRIKDEKIVLKFFFKTKKYKKLY